MSRLYFDFISNETKVEVSVCAKRIKDMKIITFVIPAYNSEKYLDKCITSMLKPECLDKIEIIIVNDGSTDKTSEIALKYCKQYPHTVLLINQENKGHGGALNTGCARAKGKYLKVIDADDWINTENLESFILKLEKCESEVVLTLYHTINVATGEVLNWRCFPPEFETIYTFSDILKDWKEFDRCFTFHGITYRTDFYQSYKKPLPEHIFYEDHVYATFPCCEAKSITPFNLFIYEYRIGDTEQSVSRINQVKRHSHTEKVLSIMEHRYLEMHITSGREYIEKKIEGLLLSYFSIVLLSHPNRREGRKLAIKQYNCCKTMAPNVIASLNKKYHMFVIMNKLGVSMKHWEYILQCQVYNCIRKNHSFE